MLQASNRMVVWNKEATEMIYMWCDNSYYLSLMSNLWFILFFHLKLCHCICFFFFFLKAVSCQNVPIVMNTVLHSYMERRPFHNVCLPTVQFWQVPCNLTNRLILKMDNTPIHNLEEETSYVNEENNCGKYFDTNCDYKFENKSGYEFLHLNIRSVVDKFRKS